MRRKGITHVAVIVIVLVIIVLFFMSNKTANLATTSTTTNYYSSGDATNNFQDSGNSGGIALSKYNNKICVLGIPTWISRGTYETQGLIQNIHNVFYKE